MSSLLTYSKHEIEKVHREIRPYIHRTPILSSQAINQLAGCTIFFKCENFQKVGAFKMRGATNALLQLKKHKNPESVVTHSSGNHAQALAKASKKLGIKAFIVMPKTAPKVKVEAVKGYGAEITFCEPNLEAREQEMEKIRAQNKAIFIPPYDHSDIIKGQASAAKEMLEDQQSLDYILCPVGGGGLLAGTALATKHFSPSTKVIGAEPTGADDAYKSFINKKLIPQKKPKTIADGLLTSLGKLNFEIIIDLVDEILCANDEDILDAMRLIWERMKIIVEPSAAVPLAVVMKNKEKFKNNKVGIILSGGNVALNLYFQQLNPNP